MKTAKHTNHPMGCLCEECTEYSKPFPEPEWRGKNLNYKSSLTHFAHQINIPLWKAMAMMKYAQNKNTANADHIVHCVNCHDELVNACKEAYLWLKDNDDINTGVFNRLSQALAKAEAAQ